MAVKKNRHAVALGRLGGLARAKNLSPEQLSEIARKGGLSGGRGRLDQLSEEDRKKIATLGGKAGGPVGGKARAAKLTKEQRQEIARKAAAARWAKSKIGAHQD